MKEPVARILAYYLPQFYPTPENNKWWGDDFTEWVNVRKAKPLFRGHQQPKIPGELGYYDLRLPEVRQAQADLAKSYGVEAFCYWHYWFGNGQRLLDRVFNEVLLTGNPDFPFCLAWANHSWEDKKFKIGGSNKTLIKQEYPGEKDHLLHFKTLLPAFQDHRYVKVDGRPLFVIYRPMDMPDLKVFLTNWQKYAIENGIAGFHFVAITYKLSEIDFLLSQGFQAVNIIRLFHFINHDSFLSRFYTKFKQRFFHRGLIVKYDHLIKYFSGQDDSREQVYPCIFPNWDHSPRSGRKEHIIINSTPNSFFTHVKRVLESIQLKKAQQKIVFLKSWNEWAEGNYIEPDSIYHRDYLKALLAAMESVIRK